MTKFLFAVLLTTLTSQAFSQRVIRSNDPGDKPGKIRCQLVAQYAGNWEDKFVFLDGKMPLSRQEIKKEMGPFTIRAILMEGGTLILQAFRTAEKRHFVSATSKVTNEIIGRSSLGNPSVRLENFGESASVSCGDMGIDINPNQN